MARSLKHRSEPPDAGVEVVLLRNRLRNLVAAKGIPKRCLARRIRISDRHLYRLLGGLTPRLDIAVATAAVLDTPIDYIWPHILRPVRIR